FFSSRRRHTRSKRDWSSDVCSSDLDESKYDNYRLYEIVDSGKWTIKKGRESIEFTQEVANSSSGYGYTYRKSLRLVNGKPEMVRSEERRVGKSGDVGGRRDSEEKRT